jgi:two-component system CheB/CheR fusion protein
MSPATSTISKYGVALLAVAVAILIRMALTPWIGSTFPLATMFTAVAFSVWYGGWGPALLTSIAGWFAAGYTFRGGVGFYESFGFNEAVSAAVYLLSTVSVIVLGEAMRSAQRRLIEQSEQLSSANLALENKVEAQSLLAAIVASSDDAIISKTLDGRITSWNRGAERLFGYSAHEAIGKSIHLIVPPEGRDEEARILDRLRHGERIDHLEVVRQRKDGTRVVMEVTISPVHDRHGQVIGASKTARDITSRKEFETTLARANESLRENRDVLALALSAGRMGVWTRDLSGDGVWWSPELARLIGMSETNPTREGVYKLIHRDDIQGVLREVERAVAERRDFRTEFRFTHGTTGELRWLEARGRATYAADGTPVMLFGLGIDTTEHKHAVEALKEADRRKDEFLATLAHELRNPLAPISSGLHIMKTARGNPQVVETAREVMERQVAQMVRLVDDLLDVARITTGKVELRSEVIDVADAIRDAVETSRPLIESRGQPLNVSLPETPVHVNADRTRLAQVFANLLNNSAKFSERGQPIAIELARDGGHALVRVRDAGAGIDPDALPKIFDMFGQAEIGAGRARGAGLGIGLSLVRRIAELHGGSVKAFSAGPGRGSEFIVRLPAADAVRVPVDQPGSVAAPAAARRRVLVVDDNLDAAESLATLLKISGHDTRMAHDGAQAVEQAEAFKPDVVFLDIGMPTIDGHETARRIRREPWGRDMVLVALTGWGQTEDRRRSKEAGFDHHLVKPADPQVVEKLISSLGH